jgi:hypothetical protein
MDADKLDFCDFAPGDEPFVEENCDNGSDSDPSGDNLPISTILKSGNLGERAMHLLGVEKPPKRSKSLPKIEPDKIKTETKLAPSVSPKQKKRPPRLPISDSGEKLVRSRNREQVQLLGTGSTQRYFAPRVDEAEDHSATSSLKMKTLEFNPQLPRGSIIIPKAATATRISSTEHGETRPPRKGSKDEIEQRIRLQTLSAGGESSARLGGVKDGILSTQSPLKMMSDRYRSRNGSMTQMSMSARRGILSFGRGTVAAEEDTAPFGIARTVSMELDHLALGMRSRDFSVDLPLSNPSLRSQYGQYGHGGHNGHRS